MLNKFYVAFILDRDFFRFFDILEIFDEENLGSPWTLKINIFVKDAYELFKNRVFFWGFISFYIFCIFQTIYIFLSCTGFDFSEESVGVQSFLFIHSFSFFIFLCSIPFCFLKFLYRDYPLQLDMLHIDVRLELPEWIESKRELDIIDDCIDVETKEDLWPQI